MEKLIHAMLTANTGVALCDSGGDNGRHWQRNAGRTLADFRNDPEADFNDGSPSVSTFHYLTRYAGLSLDVLCDAFNKKKVKDWNSDIYGVSEAGAAWLERYGFTVKRTWNTYNGDWLGDQTLQGTDVELHGINYVLLQVHGGADVRGGYTDAKLFKLEEDYMRPPEVYAEYNGKEYSTTYDGYSLKDDAGEDMPDDVKPEDVKVFMQ